MSAHEVLSLGTPGSGNHLRISLGRGDAAWHVRCEIAIEAHPFAGTVEAILFDEDVERFVTGLLSDAVPRTASLGGDRAPLLDLHLEHQAGGRSGMYAVEAEFSATGDDPYPFLRWLMVDVPPDVGAQVSRRVESALGR